jgi:hypothetical protein
MVHNPPYSRAASTAIDGDTAAIKEVFDRMDGKVTQDHNAHVEGNMRIIVNFPNDD